MSTISRTVIAACIVAVSLVEVAHADCSTFCPSAMATCPISDMKAAGYDGDVVQQCLQSGGSCGCDPCNGYAPPECPNQKSCYLLPVGGSGGVCVVRDKVCISFNQSRCADLAFCLWGESGYCEFSPPAAPPSSEANCPTLHPFAVAMIVLIFLTLVFMGAVIGVMIILRNRARAEEERLEEERDAEAAIQASKRPASLPYNQATTARMHQERDNYSYGGKAAAPMPPQQTYQQAPHTTHAASADDLDFDSGNSGGNEEAADAGGYYDEEGNWIATDGSYDPNAYGYDENGNYVGGDGGDQGGYYDEEGNWVATDGAAYEEEDY